MQAAAAPVRSSARDPMLRVKMAEVEKPKFHKREIKRYKGRYFVLKLVVVWALLMAVLAVAGHFYWRISPGRAATNWRKKPPKARWRLRMSRCWHGRTRSV